MQSSHRRLVVFCLLLTFALTLRAFQLGSARAEDAGVAEEHDAGVRSESPEGYTPRPSAFGKSRSPVDFPKQGSVVRIPIHGTIDLGISALIERALEAHRDAAAIVLDINTLGGRVDAAIRIRDALLESKVKTIAFIHPRAISAGALISLACDVIAVSPGATIGAATPIQLDQDGAKPVEEKMVSYFRTEMRTTAEAKGRRGDIAEAMVDASVVIDKLDPAGKLLTLDNQAALEWHMADLSANRVEELLKQLKLDKLTLENVEENWAEKIVRFLTDPVVSGLLMSLGTLGILIELYAPGIHIPGAVGVLCLSLFFGGHLLVHLAGVEELVLLMMGLALIAVEVLLIPGFGITGIAGIVLIFSALLLTVIGLPLTVVLSTSAWVEPLMRVTISLGATLVGLIIAIRYLPRTSAGRGLVLQTATARQQGFVSSDQSRFLERVGTAESDLRPVGVARFDDERVDVVSEGDYVAKGAVVRVVQVEGARIVVRVVS